MFYAYILYRRALDRYYLGVTADLSARLMQHRGGVSRWTSRASDWRPVFAQRFPTWADAAALELRLKQAKSRKTIERFIRNPKNEVLPV